ncbi:hypothetical protein [Parabacteroides distasonis]|uniref:DUF4783 domain-containing protein n=1 Tax=Parabacteroides distasonis TaxID=823 RepID=A0A3L7ZPX9_PARDI|nr:hypothetical protein [Parabacteroides distasonis]NBH89074.1 hypothetical protein [Parabacteroides distasonis]RLT72962.1 hypothetical protein D7V78_12930 [Parabacteroides distasonis]
MKAFRFLMLTALMLLVSSMVVNSLERVTDETANTEAVQGESLVIVLSNLYETSGHKEAVAQVLQSGGALPASNYTYEWTLNPGGGVTSCNMYYTNARKGDVIVNYNTSSSSRVEFECKVYLNGSLYTTLRYYWYLN